MAIATNSIEWYNQPYIHKGFLGEKSIWEAKSENGDTYAMYVFFDK
jgi:hypothetical protein